MNPNSIFKAFPKVDDCDVLRYLALKTKSPLALDLLAVTASKHAVSSAKQLAERYSEISANGDELIAFAYAYGLMRLDENSDQVALDIFKHLWAGGKRKFDLALVSYFVYLLIENDELALAKSVAEKNLPFKGQRQVIEISLQKKQDPKLWTASLFKLWGKLGAELAWASDSPKHFTDLAAKTGLKPISEGPLVSVIMTLFKPTHEARHAIESILNQTYQKFELILVDDASGNEYSEILDEFLQLDSRIRLVRLEKNTGTYGARNVGLLHANGEFVTGQDSDDFSHPRRLELQVAKMTKNSNLVLTMTGGVRISSDLELDIVDGNEPIRQDSTSVYASMMIRTFPALLAVGYFDSVRKGADTELVRRITSVFGSSSVEFLPELLYLVQTVPGSLSRTDFSTGWKHPNRQIYASVFNRWHAKLKGPKGGNAFINVTGNDRFPTPWGFRLDRNSTAERNIETVFLSDWYAPRATNSKVYDELSGLAGGSVAFAHAESIFGASARQGRPDSKIFELYERGQCDFVALDDNFTNVMRIVVRAEVALLLEPKVSSLNVAEVEVQSSERLDQELNAFAIANCQTVFPKARITVQ